MFGYHQNYKGMDSWSVRPEIVTYLWRRPADLYIPEFKLV